MFLLNINHNTSQMDLKISTTVLQYLHAESGRRFTRCESFEYLYTMIMETDDGCYVTSYNQLAKAWRWDNHLVKEFLIQLSNENVIILARQENAMELSFTDGFKEQSKGLSALFLMLGMKVKKASRVEAFFNILEYLYGFRNSVRLSCHQLAAEFGWSHHTVASLLNLMEKNGIVSKIPSADGKYFELGWVVTNH